MLGLCIEEMTGIKFFEIIETEMSEVGLKLQGHFDQGQTVPGTRSTHHFIPQSNIAHKLTSEDATFPFKNVIPIMDISELRPSTYVSCVYITHFAVLEWFRHPHGP